MSSGTAWLGRSGQQEAPWEDGDGDGLRWLVISISRLQRLRRLFSEHLGGGDQSDNGGGQRVSVASERLPLLLPPCPDSTWGVFGGLGSPGGLGVCWEPGCLVAPEAAAMEAMVAAPGEGDGGGGQRSKMKGATWTLPGLFHLDWNGDFGGGCGLGEARGGLRGGWPPGCCLSSPPLSAQSRPGFGLDCSLHPGPCFQSLLPPRCEVFCFLGNVNSEPLGFPAYI